MTLAVLAVTVVAGCAGVAGAPRETVIPSPSGASATPANASPDDTIELRVTATESTLFNTQRTIRLVLENLGPRPVVIESLRLESDLYESVATTIRTIEVPAGTTRLVPLPYGASRCEAWPEANGAAVTAGIDGRERDLPLLDHPTGLLERRHDRECAVAAVRARVETVFGDVWEHDVPRAARGDLLVRAMDSDVIAAVEELAGNVIFNISTPSATPLATVGPDRPEASIPVTVSADRCDVHALIESKRTFVFTATVAIADREPVVVDVEATGHTREMLERLLRACLE